MAQSYPNKKAQMAHIINLYAIANFDGNITENEKNLLFNIAKFFGITEADFKTCMDIVESDPDKVFYEVPDSNEEKTHYLKNLTTMMMIDGQVDENEKQYIKIVAEKFGYDGDKALEILMNSVYDDFAKVAAGGSADGSQSTHRVDGGQSTHRGEKQGDGEMTNDELASEMLLQHLSDCFQRKVFITEKIEEGDILLVCSDGLCDMVNDLVVEQILNESDNPVHDLYERACPNGGFDNISIVLATLKPDCHG